MVDGDIEEEKLVDPVQWFDTLKASADALDEWYAGGEVGARPPGHLRVHPRDHIPPSRRPFLHFLHAWVLDPDGRPRNLRSSGRY
jgi:hypothetical protein